MGGTSGGPDRNHLFGIVDHRNEVIRNNATGNQRGLYSLEHAQFHFPGRTGVIFQLVAGAGNTEFEEEKIAHVCAEKPLGKFVGWMVRGGIVKGIDLSAGDALSDPFVGLFVDLFLLAKSPHLF